MNERIKTLISQAQKEIWGNNPYNGSPEFEGYELDAEKFAELIVQECARVIEEDGFYISSPTGVKKPCDPFEISQTVKEHFGVEE